MTDEAAVQTDTDAGDTSSDEATLFEAGSEEPSVEKTPEQKLEEDAGKVDAAKEEGEETVLEDFTMPEGVELDAELTGELKTLAKDYGLDQAQAQKVADLGAKMFQKQQEAFADTVTQWAAEAKADKEIGGEQFAENLAMAAKAKDTYFTPEFTEFLDTTGLGNHPEMIRGLHRIAKTLGPDRLVNGGSADATVEKTHEQTMYPTMN